MITGEVVETDSHIFIDDMPIITPNGDIIVQSLSLRVCIFFFCIDQYFEQRHEKTCFLHDMQCFLHDMQK